LNRRCTTTTERVFLTRKSEVGVAIVFCDAFEGISLDADSVFFDVVGE
jgi:hypothetical protein